MKMTISEEQIRELLKPISPSRVARDGKGFSHVEAWDIRRTMNRIFGFGAWSARTDEMQLVSEREVSGRDGKTRWNVIYRARCTLEIGDYMVGGATYTEWAAGDATNPTLADAHDQAIKTAESQAFKRCAVNLGDQFGLSLYDNGSTHATVGSIVGQVFADSDVVPEMYELLSGATTMDEITVLAQRIAGLDLSPEDKQQLRAAYQVAHLRVVNV